MKHFKISPQRKEKKEERIGLAEVERKTLAHRKHQAEIKWNHPLIVCVDS